MSGRIRRLLRTVPKGAVDLGQVPALAAAREVPASGGLSPACWLAQRLLAGRLAGLSPGRCRVVGPGRLVADETLPFTVAQQPLPTGDGAGARAFGDDLDCLVVGDALAAEDDPPALLGRLVAGLGSGTQRLLVVLPGTALMPDDAASCPRRWLFSEASGIAMARQVLGERPAIVRTFGNALAASSELLGLAADRLWPDELAADDPQYPMVVAIESRLDG
jgi:hypothetical protein